jgi:hypothetical protein
MQKQLIEHGRLAEANATSERGVYDITIITEGEGSSGIYKREMLEANAHVWSKGTKGFIDHPTDPNKPWERSLESLASKFIDDARYVEEDGVAKLKTRIKVREKYIDFVEEFKDTIGLSIFCGAYGEEDPATGKTVVEEFDAEDPYRSVDLVVAAGRGGRFDLAMESYRKIENSLPNEEEEQNGSGNPAEPHNQSKEDSHMEIEELAGKVDALTEALSAFITDAKPILESLKPGEPVEVDEAEVVESLIESNLTKRSRKAVLEAVRNGAAVEDAIKEQKAVEDEFRNELRVQEGRVQGDESFNGEVTDLGKVFD